MKKKLFFLAIGIFATNLIISAQPRAVGLRLGPKMEISFHQFMNSEANLLEVDFGTSINFKSLQGAATYNWASTSSSGEWMSYAGFGIGGGYTSGSNNWSGKKTVFLTDFWTWGLVGMVGIEYKLPNLPIGISLDYRPLFGFDFGNKLGSDKLGVQYHTPGLWNFGVSARFFLM
jgi:hypothetical protein